MKADTPELIKFKHLKHLLDRPAFAVAGVLESLWIATAKNAFMGDIGRFTNAQIASILEWDGDADVLIEALCESRWLDRVDGPARLVIHDWYDNAAQYIVQKIHRKLGLTVEQLKSHGGKELARDSWWKCICMHMCGESKEGGLHMQNGTQQPNTYAHARANPSLPSPTLPPPPTPSGDDGAWEAAAAEVVEVGVGTGFDSVAACRQRGCFPDDVRSVVAFWKQRQPAWGPGGLAYRLDNLRHGQKSEDPNLWPPPSKAAAFVDSSADRERVAADAEAKRQAAAAKLEADDVEESRLESEHGSDVNVMNRERIRELAAECMTPGELDLLCKRIAKLPLPRGVLRTIILKHLDSQGARTP